MAVGIIVVCVAVLCVAVLVLKRRGANTPVDSEAPPDAALIELDQLANAYAVVDVGEYISRSMVDRWNEELKAAIELANGPGNARRLPKDQRAAYAQYRTALCDLTGFARTHNAAFVPQRIAEDHARFDAIEAYPLTARQREAVVTDEDTTLVVAGAGTGKTSVIVAKADYLIRHGLAKPGEILLLAFNRAAADEIGRRLVERGVPAGAVASTFHSFGRTILSETTQRSPTLSVLAGGSRARPTANDNDEASDEEDDSSVDRRELKHFVNECLHDLLADPQTAGDIIQLFTDDIDETPDQEGSPVKPNQVLIAELQALGTIDLTGTRLKSRQEVKIANWLTLNGIRWEYERPYPIETATRRRRQYQPDFYLPDYDLYIEHFGINCSGNPAPWIDAESYRKGIEWKREVHAEGGTTLIETTSCEDSQRQLMARLEARLRAHGVEPRQLSREELAEILNLGNQEYNKLVDLICQFLAVFKGGGSRRDEVQSKANSKRDQLFLRTFFSVFDAYELELRNSRTIDFDDMINIARGYLESGAYRSPYKYIIVDEFQDISANRLGLLQAARKQVRHGRLFVVGDDWQSIYRFTGSDVSIVTHLSETTGATARVDLDTTFRYPQSILDVTSRFIMENPHQLRKQIRSHSADHSVRPVLIISSEHNDESNEPLQIALADIARQSEAILNAEPGRRVSVYVIGRYRHSRPKEIGLRRVETDDEGHERVIPPATFAQVVRLLKRDRIDVTFTTAHRAKGKEADFVVILDVNKGRLGFPSTVSDDPVMDLVLTVPDDFPHAEERRLFYVAMTRARRRIYITASSAHPSIFLDGDLLGPDYAANVEQVGPMAKRHRCPDCHGITILRRTGRNGYFWGCTNFPHCLGKLELCPACKEGCMVLDESDPTTFRCSDCGKTASACPRCRKGTMMVRQGSNGAFEGCSNWNYGTGCTYTRNI